MPVYTCQRCFKIFKQKSHYIRHQQRKYPCDDKNPLEKMVEKVIHNMNNNSQEKMDNNVHRQHHHFAILFLKVYHIIHHYNYWMEKTFVFFMKIV